MWLWLMMMMQVMRCEMQRTYKMLDRLCEGNDNDDTSSSDNDDYFDNVDSDNESCDGTCNTF